jgi:hypothetical protein
MVAGEAAQPRAASPRSDVAHEHGDGRESAGEHADGIEAQKEGSEVPTPGDADGSSEAGESPRADGRAGEAGGEGYKPVDEALRAGAELAGVLREAGESVRELMDAHAAEVAQAAGLPDAIGRLTEAVDALTRTVLAVQEELSAGRGGGSLPVVAVVQKSTADGAAEDAVSQAPDGPVRKALRAVIQKLDQAGKWLWSMIVHLVTIREWSLGGKLKVPGFAEANLTVIFGG